MEQESERIEKHIEERREQLGRNLEELESRVKSNFDWRTHYSKNPWLVLAIAFTGGAAVGAMVSGDSRSSSYGRRSYTGSGGVDSSSQAGSRLASTWGNIQGAVLTAATRKVEDFLDELLPGFRDEYRTQRGQQRGGDSSSPSIQ